MKPHMERLVSTLAIRSEFRICFLEPTLWEKGKWLDKILREPVGNFLWNTNAGLFLRERYIYFSSHWVSDVRNSFIVNLRLSVSHARTRRLQVYQPLVTY